MTKNKTGRNIYEELYAGVPKKKKKKIQGRGGNRETVAQLAGGMNRCPQAAYQLLHVQDEMGEENGGRQPPLGKATVKKGQRGHFPIRQWRERKGGQGTLRVNNQDEKSDLKVVIWLGLLQKGKKKRRKRFP